MPALENLQIETNEFLNEQRQKLIKYFTLPLKKKIKLFEHESSSTLMGELGNFSHILETF